MAVKWHDDSWFRSTFVSKLTPCNLRGPVPLQYSAQYTVQALYSADRGDHWPELTSSATRHSLLTLTHSAHSAHLWPRSSQCRGSGGQSPHTRGNDPGMARVSPAQHQPPAPTRPLLLSYAIIASLTNYMGTGGHTRIFGTNTKYESQLTIRYLSHD